jgi:hypothetical protein
MHTQQIAHRFTNGSIDIELPLHPDTGDCEHVALLVQRILNEVDQWTSDGETPSQADVVQALTIATALRAAFAEVSARAGRTLTPDLLDIAVEEPNRHLNG